MSKHPSNLWSEGLKLVSYCPLCETRYQPSEARMIAEDGETHLVHVRCGSCENAVLALVMMSNTGSSSIGLITDLSFEDVLRFRARKRVAVNDVIRMHEFLEGDGLRSFLPEAVHERRPVRESAKTKQTRL